MDHRSALRPDALSHLDACRCSDLDALLESFCGRIDELEADVRCARSRHAAAVTKLEELTSVARQLGRELLLAGTGSVSTRSRAEVEAAGIVEEAEAQALEITKRGDAVTAQLQSFEAFLNALHTPVFDDTAFGSASSPST